MLPVLGALRHQAMRDMDLVPRPFRGEGSEDPNEPLNTYHNQNVSYTSVAKGFAVRVHSDRISTSYDLRPKKRVGTSEEGHKFYTEITAGRDAHRNLLRSAPFFDRSDDSAALESTDRINILHHADPFSYQLTRHARPANLYDSGFAESDPIGRCNNEYQFDEHARVTRTAFPGPGTENRLDVIENARLMGRNTIRAVENTALEEPAINKAAGVGVDIGNAIGGSGQPHGLIGVAHGLASGGSVSAALHATPAILAAPAISYGMNRINRYTRLRGVLSGKEALKRRARDAFQEARDTREFYLDTAEEKVLNMDGYRRDTVVREWNAEKANLKEHTSDFETMYPQYLDKLDSVSSSGGSVAKKFAGNFAGGEIGVTPLATGLKLANAAEAHAIVKLYNQAKEAGLEVAESQQREAAAAAAYVPSYSPPSSSYTRTYPPEFSQEHQDFLRPRDDAYDAAIRRGEPSYFAHIHERLVSFPDEAPSTDEAFNIAIESRIRQAMEEGTPTSEVMQRWSTNYLPFNQAYEAGIRRGSSAYQAILAGYNAMG